MSTSEPTSTQALVDELLEERDRLKLGIEARDQFLARVSHELRSPVQALLLHLEATMMLGERQPNATEWMRGRTAKAVTRVRELNEMLDRFLDVTRIQAAGRVELFREDVDLVKVVRDSLGRMRDELSWAGCAVTVAAPAAVRGRWDATRLESIVTNLVGNARKYGAGKPVEVKVEESDASAILVVQDRGPGIAPEHRERIFERFERIVHRGGPTVSGLGLGLWITRHLVEAHGGSIAVDDRPDGGARFTVTLPR